MPNDPILTFSEAEKYLGPVKDWIEFAKINPEGTSKNPGIRASLIIEYLTSKAVYRGDREKKQLQNAVNAYPDAAKIAEKLIEKSFLYPTMNTKEAQERFNEETQGRLDVLHKAMRHELALQNTHVEDGTWVSAPNVGTAKPSTRQV